MGDMVSDLGLITRQSDQAIGSVVEAGECFLCKVELQVHDERACSPSCGDSEWVRIA
jgi:hypothetical protein